MLQFNLIFRTNQVSRDTYPMQGRRVPLPHEAKIKKQTVHDHAQHLPYLSISSSQLHPLTRKTILITARNKPHNRQRPSQSLAHSSNMGRHLHKAFGRLDRHRHQQPHTLTSASESRHRFLPKLKLKLLPLRPQTKQLPIQRVQTQHLGPQSQRRRRRQTAARHFHPGLDHGWAGSGLFAAGCGRGW